MQKQKRTAWQIINDMEISGDLKTLAKAGFCNPKVLSDIEIVRRVDAKIHTGTVKSHAVDQTAEDFNCCNRTVFRILKTAKNLGKV